MASDPADGERGSGHLAIGGGREFSALRVGAAEPAPVPSRADPADTDDFWEWFDAPVEVPDRPRRRAPSASKPVEPARRVAEIAAWGVLIGCFIVAGLLVLPTLVGWKVLSVQSASMAPAIDAGDAVVVKTVFSADLRSGDVVTYRPADDPSVLITHRVVSIEFNQASNDFSVVTKGDRNGRSDPLWRAAPSQTFGKVVTTYPKMGYLLNFIAGPRGKIVAIVAFVIFVVAGWLSRRRAQQVAEDVEDYN